MERQEKVDILEMFARFPKLVRLGIAAGKAFADLSAQTQQEQKDQTNAPAQQKPA